MLCHGVMRKGMQCLHPPVIQEEGRNSDLACLASGTVKAAVLKGDERCPDLVASSVYDTKPAHFLSMVCADLKSITLVKDRWRQ